MSPHGGADAARGPRVLVTGGAGFIGSHLVDHLLASPETGEVRVLDNFATGSKENLADAAGDERLHVIEGDIRDRETVSAACGGVVVVFHLACLGVRHSLHRPEENHDVNATGTLRLIEAARHCAVPRFVHVSTSEVFGTAQHAPMDEAHPTWPETVYGASKLAGEAYARAAFRTHGFPAVVVRPFNNYGSRSHFEHDSGEVIPRSVVRVLAGRPPLIFGDGQQTRDFLHVSDCVRALVDLAACEAAVGETVNVGYGEECTIEGLCQSIADLAGRPDLRPEHLEARPGDVRRLWVDNRRVRELIDFNPDVKLEQGLLDVIAWFSVGSQDPEEMLSKVADRNWVAGSAS